MVVVIITLVCCSPMQLTASLQYRLSLDSSPTIQFLIMKERQNKHDELEALQMSNEQPGLSDTDSVKNTVTAIWQLL